MKQILVTGGTGTLGKEIVYQLIAKKYRPDILSSRISPDLPAGARILKGDLTEKNSLPEVIANAEIIIHCASNPRNSDKVDVEGTRNLLEAVNYKKSPHIIYISIVGANKSTYPYYQNKCKVEEMIQESKLPWSILRVTQFHDFVLYRIINSLEAGNESIFKIPKGLKFQSIDVEDIAKYILNLVTHGPIMSIINLGGPQILSIEEMTKIYLNEIGKQDKVEEVLLEDDFYNIFMSGINLCPEDRIGFIRWKEFIRNNLKKQLIR